MHIDNTTSVDVKYIDDDVFNVIAGMVALGWGHNCFRFSLNTRNGYEVAVRSKNYEDDYIDGCKWVIKVIQHYKKVEGEIDVEDYDPPLEIINVEVETDAIRRIKNIGVSVILRNAINKRINEIDDFCGHADASAVISAIFGGATS